MMIDDLEKTERLMELIKENLPLPALITHYLAAALKEKNPDLFLPEKCFIKDVVYSGDMGGILCVLDCAETEPAEGFVASLTHLGFYKNMPLAQEITAYQKHRIKALKKKEGIGGRTPRVSIYNPETGEAA